MLAERRIDDVWLISEALSKRTIESLDERLQEKYFRISAADDIIRIHGINQRSVRMLATRFDISHPIAKQLMNEAQQLFGSTKTHEKDYWKTVALDWLIRMITANNKRMFITNQDGELTDEFKPGIGPKDIESFSKLQRELFRLLGTAKDGDDPIDQALPELILITANPEDIGLKKSQMSVKELRERFDNMFAVEAVVIKESNDGEN